MTAATRGAILLVDDEEKILKWANWTAYLDMNGKETKSPTLEAFMQETGIEVSYSEDIDDNDSYYAKVGPQLRAGQSIDRDIITMTDWMAARMIGLGWMKKLDHDNLPNVEPAPPVEVTVEPEHDNTRTFSVRLEPHPDPGTQTLQEMNP